MAISRSPPMFWAMSAKIVVVVTTLRTAAVGEPLGPGLADGLALGGAPPWQAARTTARTATTGRLVTDMRLSRKNERSGALLNRLGEPDQASSVVFAWQCRQSPNSSRRWESMR